MHHSGVRGKSCRNLSDWVGCRVQVPSLTEGGPAIAWYGDLTIVDPYYTLPIISSLMLLLTVELNAADGLQVPACRL